jgi:hypothetical protein
MDNNEKCSQLLNSRELVDFLIQNVNKTELNQAKDWIEKMINRKKNYSIYKKNYFFQKIKNI